MLPSVEPAVVVTAVIGGMAALLSVGLVLVLVVVVAGVLFVRS